MANFKVIGIIKPFETEQNLYVYEGSEKRLQKTVSLDNFVITAVQLCNEYAVDKIDIVGPHNFTQKFGREIEKLELIEYTLPLTINYI